MKILDYIVCDDIRLEINNKFTLVGTYNDRIEFIVRDGMAINFPISIPLAFLIRILPEGNADVTDIQVDFYTNKKHTNSSRLKLTSFGQDFSRPLALPIVSRSFVLEKGEMQFIVSFYKNEALLAKSEPSIPFLVTVRG